MLRELPLEPFLLHVLGCVCMQIDKILLEVAGETLSQMAAAPKQQKQVRAGTGRPSRARLVLPTCRSCRSLGARPSAQPFGSVTLACPPSHHAVQAEQQRVEAAAEETGEMEDLQSRMAAIRS